jgi:hypothetical protein
MTFRLLPSLTGRKKREFVFFIKALMQNNLALPVINASRRILIIHHRGGSLCF